MNTPEASGWIAGFCKEDAFDHPVKYIKLLETHISWVVLTGDYAYKIKKPVQLGFLDFTKLAARQRFCEEELRLNRRLAPQLYLDVVAITGSPTQPRVFGGGTVSEYAVKMREFPQSALASRLLGDGAISGAQLDALAAKIAAFHAATGIAARGSPYGTPEAVIAPAHENFSQIEPMLPQVESRSQLAALRVWTDREFHALRSVFGERQSAGFVRECHGDMHLGNIATVAGELTPFDCIEFNPAFRWLDVMNEVAFLFMDLMDRGRADLGWRFLNTYLEITGDYEGLRVLRYYLVYRALVRAKVHGIRAHQAAHDAPEHARLLGVCRQYMALAARMAHKPRPACVAMHGFSGSGKSFVSRQLLESLGAIRVRSDVERKRLHGLTANGRGTAVVGEGMYCNEATHALYALLMTIGRSVLETGYSLVLDAAFLKRSQRMLATDLARSCATPFVLVTCHAPPPELYARVNRRAKAGSDASEAGADVLTHQLSNAEELTSQEQAENILIDTTLLDLCPAIRAVSDRVSKPPPVSGAY